MHSTGKYNSEKVKQNNSKSLQKNGNNDENKKRNFKKEFILK